MTKRNPFAKDLPEAAQGLREQATSVAEPVSSPELHPRNSMAVGSESMPNTNGLTPMCLVHPEHFMPCSRCLGYGCTACDNGVQAADDRRSL